MLEDLSHLSGLRSTALLGDVHLLAGDRVNAGRVYLEAWRQGEARGLASFLALEAEYAPLDLLSELGRELKEAALEGVVSEAEAELLGRLLLTTLSVVRVSVPEAGALALELLPAIPGVSFPLALRGVDATASKWLEACRALWERLLAAEEVDERGNLIFKLHHLSVALSVREVSGDDALMDLAAQGATGALLYLVLKRLDRLAENGPVMVEEAKPNVPLGDVEDEPGFVTTQVHHKIGNFLKFLANHVQDSRERAVFRTRYADWLWTFGDLDKAADVYSSLLEEGPVAVADLARERLQRLCVARGRWQQASGLVLDRAERCDDVTLRMSLLLLSLAYLYEAEADPEEYMDIAERVLSLESKGRRLPPAPFRHAYEIVEGVLLETGQWERLGQLWGRGRTGGGGAEVQRMPERSIERQVFRWVRDDGGPREVDEGPFLHRLRLVRALREGQFERALVMMARAKSSDDDGDLLKASLTLSISAGFDQSSKREKIGASARESLRRSLDEAESVGVPELLALFSLRDDLKRRGNIEEVLETFSAAMQLCPPSLRATLATEVGRDLFEAGEAQRALGLAREAFALHPTDKAVRDFYSDVATEVGDDAALGQLADFVDDEELAELLAGSPQRAERFARAQQLALKGDGGTFEASDLLADLADEVTEQAAQAALLRRSAEMRWAGRDEARAVELALAAVQIRRDDRLAVRTALDILLACERWPEISELLELAGGLEDLPEQLSERMLAAGRAAAEQGETGCGLSLTREALLSLPPQRLDLVRDAVEALEAYCLELKDPWRWRDTLERFVRQDHGAQITGLAHAQLGAIFEDHLPDRSKAIEHYRAALGSGLVRGAALDSLERLFNAAGQDLELVEVLRTRAAEADDEARTDCLETLARVLVDRLGEVEEARELLDKVLTANPRNLKALLKAAELDRRLERWEGLVGNLENAARLVDDQTQRSDLYHQIGFVYEQLDQGNLALENYMVSFICDNRNADTFERLEELYNRSGRWSELVGIYDVALDVYKQDPGCGYEAELLYARKSQVEFYHLERERAAASSLLEALRINPKETRYAGLLENIAGSDRAPDVLAEAYKLQIEGLPHAEPRRRELMHQLAAAYERMGNMQEEALEVYRGILAVWPADNKSAERLEGLCKRLERWSELVDLYRERLKTVSGSEKAIPLYWAIAQVAERKLRDLDMAVATYEALLEVVPGNLDVLRALARLFEATKQWDRLVAVSRREVKLTDNPEKKAHVFFKLGSIYETVKQDFDTAIECYEAAVELDHRCVPALHGLREIYRRQGKWKKVVLTLEREARLWEEPREKASIHTMIAEVSRSRLEDLVETERHALEALKLSPGLPGALRLLLELQMEQGRWKEAEGVAAQLIVAMEGKPAKARASIFTQRAKIAQALGERDREAAWLRNALDLDPEDEGAFDAFLVTLEEPGGLDGEEQRASAQRLEAHFLERERKDLLSRLMVHRGRHCEASGRLGEAEDLMERAAALCPLSDAPRRSLAALLRRSRRFEEARRVLERCLERHGSAQESAALPVLLDLADLHTDWMRQPEVGMGLYLRALELGPADPAALFKAAQCAYVLGRWEEARRWMEALVEMGDVEAPSLSERERCLHRFYHGRVLEVGFSDTEGALALYLAAVELCAEEVEPAVAAALILAQRGEWERVDGLVNAAKLNSKTPAAGLRLMLLEGQAHQLRGDFEVARRTYRELLSRAGPHLRREAALDLLGLPPSASEPEGERVDLLEELLDEGLLDAQVLTLLFDHQLNLDRQRAAGLIASMVALGLAPEALVDRVKVLGLDPPSRDLAGGPGADLQSLRLDPPILGTSVTASLASLASVLPVIFPTDREVMAPPPPAAVSPQTALREEAAAALGALRSCRFLVGGGAGPGGVKITCVNRCLAGGDDPVGLVTVASALGGDPDPAYARRAISFLNGCGLALLHLDLAPCVAMRPSELGACVEVLDHLIRGGSLAELAGRLHLRSAVESLGGADLSQHLRAAVEAAESAQTHPTPLVQRPQAMAFAQSLLDGLEVFADRAGFLACGDLGVALDVLVAMEEGLAITALTPERRRHHLESSPRARLLVRHALSPRRIASLAQEAQPS